MRALQALQSNPAVGSATRTRALLLLAQADEARDDANSERLLVQALATARAEQLRRPFRESARWVRHQLRRHPRLAQGHAWLPDDLLPPAPKAADPGDDVPPVETLTARECAVLVRAGRMMSTEEIAEDLFVSANTVKTHLKSINRKLGTANRRDAVRRARRLRLLDES
ncbi:LuxR C-terminal-related transcriptional regulator [Streptacidiphilus monticola]